jgi:limonene-1,2-epoxide hydrolase
MTTDPSQVVASFIAAVEGLDVESAVALLAPDVTYDNVPVGPIIGRDAAKATLASFLGVAEQVEWRVLRQVADGRAVANERLDRFRFPGGWLELPVAGFFEVGEDGLISLWRDYFDLATYTRAMEALTPSD